MFWPVFLECPRCNKHHESLEVSFSPNGDTQLTTTCCERVLGLIMKWEDVVAGATRQEEAFLLQSPEGKKKFGKKFSKEN